MTRPTQVRTPATRGRRVRQCVQYGIPMGAARASVHMCVREFGADSGAVYVRGRAKTYDWDPTHTY